MPRTVEQLCGILYVYFGVASLVIASRSDSHFTKALTQLHVFQNSTSCVCDCFFLCMYDNLMYNRDSGDNLTSTS